MPSVSLEARSESHRTVDRSEVSISPEKLKLLERRPSKVESVFEVEPPKAPFLSLRRMRHIMGKKTKRCIVTFKDNELIFSGAKESSKQMYACDLRTTLVRLAGKRGNGHKHKNLTKMELITAGGHKHRIYAESIEEAEKLLSAVCVERQFALEGDAAGINHGKELLEMVRNKDISNRMCADCQTPNPAWVSYHKLDGMVSLICGACAGYHRKLGTGNVFVQSLLLDSKAWQPDVKDERAELRAALPSASNAKVNRIRSVGMLKRRASLMQSSDGVAHDSFSDTDQGHYIYEKYAKRRGRSLTTPNNFEFAPDDDGVISYRFPDHKRRRTVDVELY